MTSNLNQNSGVSGDKLGLSQRNFHSANASILLHSDSTMSAASSLWGSISPHWNFSKNLETTMLLQYRDLDVDVNSVFQILCLQDSDFFVQSFHCSSKCVHNALELASLIQNRMDTTHRGTNEAFVHIGEGNWRCHDVQMETAGTETVGKVAVRAKTWVEKVRDTELVCVVVGVINAFEKKRGGQTNLTRSWPITMSLAPAKHWSTQTEK